MGVRVSILCVMLALFAAAPQSAGATICTPEEEDKATTLTDDQLKNWAAVDEFYKNLRQCDDGGIAEGLSDSVVGLLAHKWNDLPALAALIEKDPELKKFVLGHIDTTVNDDDLQRIVKQAKTQCPAAQQALCQVVGHAATEASRNMRTGAN